jgi:hypothetical protein
MWCLHSQCDKYTVHSEITESELFYSYSTKIPLLDTSVILRKRLSNKLVMSKGLETKETHEQKGTSFQ